MLGDLAPWDPRSSGVSHPTPNEPQLEGEQSPTWAKGLPTLPASLWTGDAGMCMASPSHFKSTLSLHVGGCSACDVIKRCPGHRQAPDTGWRAEAAWPAGSLPVDPTDLGEDAREHTGAILGEMQEYLRP